MKSSIVFLTLLTFIACQPIPEIERSTPKIEAGVYPDYIDSNEDGFEEVTLKAKAEDTEDNIISYRVLEGRNILLSGKNASVFSSKLKLSLGEHKLIFEATDLTGLTGSDEATINVSAAPVTPPTINTAPIVTPGPSVAVTDSDNNGSELIQLQASATDKENNIVSYSILRNGASFLSGTASNTFAQSFSLSVGTHNLTLIATDSQGLQGSATVVVTVNRYVAPAPTLAGLLAEGDSITASGASYAGLFGSYRPDIPFTNQAVGGSGMNNVNSRQATALAKKPRVLSLLIGANDLGTNSAAYAESIFKYLEPFRALGTKVVVGTVLPQKSASFNVARRDLNARLRSAVGSKIDAVVDFEAIPEIGGDAKAMDTIYFPDGVHPSGDSHRLMFIAYKKIIEPLYYGANIPADRANTKPRIAASVVPTDDKDGDGFGSVKLQSNAVDDENNIKTYNVYLDGSLVLSAATSHVLTATIPARAGTRTVKFEVIDEGNLSASASTTFSVGAAPVTPPPTGVAPVANAGPDIMKINTDLAGGVMTLTVTGTAQQGTNPIVSYAWKNNGVIVQKSNTPTILTQNKINFIKGNNLLTLEVTDSKGLKGVDHAIVEIRPNLDDAPFLGRATIPGVLSISAGGQRIIIDQDNNGSETVRMVGSVNSVYPITSYKWIRRGQVMAEGNSPDVLTTSLNLPLGINQLWLEVQDSKGNLIKDVIGFVVTSPVVEQKPRIPSNFNTADYLKEEWATGPAHWKDNSAFRFRCKASHFLYDDPIVFPGQPGKSHLHMFFGNTMANGNSTYESLRQTGDGSCDGGPLNRSAYWMPAVLNENGKVAVPDHITIYYKKHPGTNRIPRGLRMIFGFDHRYPDKKIKKWKCANGGGEFESIPEVNCPADQQLMVTLSSPECWDGKNLDSADHRSHMSYGSYNGYGEYVCPATHPVLIPAFSMLISWSHSGYAEYSKWRLASDHVSPHDPNSTPLPPGSTMHSDWFGGWDDDVMDMWHDGCMDQFKSCSGGALGMGKQLKENPGFSFKTIDRIIDPPVKPLP